MRRATVLIGALCAAGLLVPAGATAETSRGDKRACDTINLGGPKIFNKHNMRCETAKHYARRVYKTTGQDEPRNFSCSSGSNFREGGFCEHDSKNKYFGWHPADKRKRATLDSYCSPSGDYCLAVTKRRGRIKFEISTFSFEGAYTLCVKGPKDKDCIVSKLSASDMGIHSDRVDWLRRFESQGAGHYKVVWGKFGGRLGEALRFSASAISRVGA